MGVGMRLGPGPDDCVVVFASRPVFSKCVGTLFELFGDVASSV